MRTEQEMVDLILHFAREDERIRAVILNGSRVNPNAPKDIFQDYDIQYLVTSVKDFVQDQSWIRNFGELIIMQTSDDMDDTDDSEDLRFAFLMLFSDGNRIDLTFHQTDRMDALTMESLSLVLLDKDGIVGELEPPSNSDHETKPPTDRQYANCCNEFWWVSTYIAKGLWRRELPYARFMFEGPVRSMLHRMVGWYIGVLTDFTADAGKCGKYFEKHLPTNCWDAYVQSLPNGSYEDMWRSLFVMCDLFRELATTVGRHFGYPYPSGDDERVTKYLQRVRDLPQDAPGIY